MRADLETDVRAAAAAGFEYLEIWAAKLHDYLKTHSTSDLKSLFAEHKVTPLSINSIEHVTFRDEIASESIKQQCRDLSQIAEEIDCHCIVVVPGKLPADGASREEIVDESVRVLNELCDIAEPHHVTLAFEFLGQTDCSVPALDLAHEIVAKANRANLGLIIDSFHFYAGNSTIDMIDKLDPQLVQVFHINDAEDLPRETLEDRHRLLPGLGILPLNDMVQAFNRIGYDRFASIEIFRPEYWAMDPFELAKQSHSQTQKVLSASLR